MSICIDKQGCGLKKRCDCLDKFEQSLRDRQNKLNEDILRGRLETSNEELIKENARLKLGLMRITNIDDEDLLRDTKSILTVCNLFKHIARETLDADRSK